MLLKYIKFNPLENKTDQFSSVDAIVPNVNQKGNDSDHSDNKKKRIKDLLDRLPKETGVYLFKDHQGKVLYVGKAKQLFSRVRSYFTKSGDTRPFVPQLEYLVDEIETIITQNEKEALLLENTLIKQYHPRFNVMLRDDKNYLVLRLDLRVPYPRLEITRRIRNDGARYFGPYHSATDCRQTLRLVNRYFQLRTCNDRTMNSRKRPCLQWQIRRCLAPCACSVDPAQYAKLVEDVTLFLRGKSDILLKDLEQRMQAAAAEFDFEQAARFRDQITAVRSSLEKQQAVSDKMADWDIFGFYREGDRVSFAILFIRQGKLMGRRSFYFTGQEFPDEELLSSVISRFYDGGCHEIPQKVMVPMALEDTEAKQQWLSDLREKAVEIIVPCRGSKRQLLELAQRNAQSDFQTRRQRETDMEISLAKLQHRLRLSRLPRRIECYDISGFQGQMVVASMVVLIDGEPHPPSYRLFKISLTSKDDFAAIYEVISRRLRRARNQIEGWALPDLIVVDGGKAQLSMALAALRDLGLPEGAAAPNIVALAKARTELEADPTSANLPDINNQSSVSPSSHPHRSDRLKDLPDRVFLPHLKDPIRLRPNTTELFLLARIRDEAHRFAITYHRKLRQRKALRSGLEDIPGIGLKRKKLLLKTLGSIKRIREASIQELTAIPGMSSKAAEAVVAYFASVPPANAASTEESKSKSNPKVTVVLLRGQKKT